MKILLFLCIIYAFAHETTTPHLSEEEYNALPKDVDKFIMFYAPWCPHCVRLMPTWDRLSEEYEHIYLVNCDVESALKYRFGIKGFPSLMFIPKNSEIAYKHIGNRQFEELIKFKEEGWKNGQQYQILKEVNTWDMMIDELKNPMILGALGIMLFIVLLILIMCILDKKEEKKFEQKNKNK